MRAAFVVALAVVALLVACAGWDDPNPAATAPSSLYPCGAIGVVCSEAPAPVGATCCDEGETCGGNVGCPPGYCCDVRDFDPTMAARAGDAGAVFVDGGKVVRVRGPVRRWAPP